CFGRVHPRSTIERAIEQAIESSGDDVAIERAADPVARLAELLAGGEVVAWFRGRSEFGPRALGHRSILADPRSPHVRDHINAKTKRREASRPFAPAVLREDAATCFDCDHESPYMLLVAPVRPQWRERIPAVVHADGSCRLQTVTKERDPEFHALLTAF